MTGTTGVTRRELLIGGAGLLGAAALGGCVSRGGTEGGVSGGGTEGGGQGAVTLTVQSYRTTPDERKAMEQIVSAYETHPVTLNSVATEQFRAQLSTYLNSPNPPDVLTWLAGSVARDYASKGFLLDVSKLWSGSGPLSEYSQALRDLSTYQGKQIFAPDRYFWFGLFYRKSHFEEQGATIPATWEEFIELCRMLKDDGIHPLTAGTGTTPWVASAWFDYINLRVNGPEFHRELLAGEHAFDGPEVREVMRYYAQIVPFFDPRGTSYSFQEAMTPLVQGEAAMYLAASSFLSVVPEDVMPDMDFFSVPTIAEGVPRAEEAPTDGYFASARSDNEEASLDLLAHLTSPESQRTLIDQSAAGYLPTSPDVDLSQASALVHKGRDFLEQADELTQFFNRDSSDELQATADTALTKFLDRPDDVDAILSQWQAAAEKVWGS